MNLIFVAKTFPFSKTGKKVLWPVVELSIGRIWPGFMFLSIGVCYSKHNDFALWDSSFSSFLRGHLHMDHKCLVFWSCWIYRAYEISLTNSIWAGFYRLGDLRVGVCVRVCGCLRFFMTWSSCLARQEQGWSLRECWYCSCFVRMWFLSWTRRHICEDLDFSQPCPWRHMGVGVALDTLSFCSAVCVCEFLPVWVVFVWADSVFSSSGGLETLKDIVDFSFVLLFSLKFLYLFCFGFALLNIVISKNKQNAAL